MTRVLAFVYCLLLVGLSSCGEPDAVPESFVRAEPWDEQTLELAATLPVQHSGRIKPLDTLGGFQLLKINGKRSLKLPSGEKLTRTGFLLDCFFFPAQVKDYPCFLVQNDGVVIAMGVEPKGRRARYSCNEL